MKKTRLCSLHLFCVFLLFPMLSFGQNDTKTKPSPPPPVKRAPAQTRPVAPVRPNSPTQQRPAATTSQGTSPRGGPTAIQPGHGTPTSKAASPRVRPPVASPKAPVVPTSRTTNARSSQPKVVPLRTGGTATVNAAGKVRTIDTKGVHVEHHLAGGRQVVSTRNNVTIVSNGAHRGYVQRPYAVRNGHTYVQRTYVVNNVTYTRVYCSYYYRGATYYGYYPAYYYRPGFYLWASSPWPRPVYYGWGWGPQPWSGYYGGYFTPYPVYASAPLWLTDYLLAENLRVAYDARSEGAPPDAVQEQPSDSAQGPATDAAAATPLSPEVKQAIAEEVKQQLDAEKTAAQPQSAAPAPTSDQAPTALLQRTYIVSSNMDVTADGQECALTPGDVITRISEPDTSQNVNILVTSAKRTDCATGKQASVTLNNLQEMHNHFCEQIDEGMKTLADKQGHEGIPAAPDTQTVTTEVPAPSPDADAAAQLQDQQKTADDAEAEAVWNITHAGMSEATT